jgi:hypothetical protein
MSYLRWWLGVLIRGITEPIGAVAALQHDRLEESVKPLPFIRMNFSKFSIE